MNMDKSLIEIIQEWRESDFKTGLILHVGDDMKDVKRKKYQKFINQKIKEIGMKDIRLLMFSPFEDFKLTQSYEVDNTSISDENIPIFQPLPKRRGISVYIEEEVYVVDSPGVERIATRIDYEDWMARMQFYKHLKTTGVVKALEDAGIKSGDTVRIGEVEWDWD